MCAHICIQWNQLLTLHLSAKTAAFTLRSTQCPQRSCPCLHAVRCTQWGRGLAKHPSFSFPAEDYHSDHAFFFLPWSLPRPWVARAEPALPTIIRRILWPHAETIKHSWPLRGHGKAKSPQSCFSWTHRCLNVRNGHLVLWIPPDGGQILHIFYVKMKTVCGHLIIIQLFFPVILPFPFSFNLAPFSRKISRTKPLLTWSSSTLESLYLESCLKYPFLGPLPKGFVLAGPE